MNLGYRGHNARPAGRKSPPNWSPCRRLDTRGGGEFGAGVRMGTSPRALAHRSSRRRAGSAGSMANTHRNTEHPTTTSTTANTHRNKQRSPSTTGPRFKPAWDHVRCRPQGWHRFPDSAGAPHPISMRGHGYASLAQLAEHALRERMVMGSIPIGGLLSCLPPHVPLVSLATTTHRGGIPGESAGDCADAVIADGRARVG